MASITTQILRPFPHTILTLQEIVKKLETNLPSTGWFIAGGAALSLSQNTAYNDIDIYCESKEIRNRVEKLLNHNNTKETSPNAINYWSPFGSGKDIQLITTNIGTPEKVLSTFDLNCCKIAYIPNKALYYHPDFEALPSFSLKNLSVNSISRAIKYAQRLHVSIDFDPLTTYINDNPNAQISDSYDTTASMDIKHIFRASNRYSDFHFLMELLSSCSKQSTTVQKYAIKPFIPPDILTYKEFSSLSPFIQAHIYWKTEITPPAHIRNKFPELSF